MLARAHLMIHVMLLAALMMLMFGVSGTARAETAQCNPAQYNPALCNPALCNPALCNPALCNPALCNPALCADELELVCTGLLSTAQSDGQGVQASDAANNPSVPIEIAANWAAAEDSSGGDDTSETEQDLELLFASGFVLTQKRSFYLNSHLSSPRALCDRRSAQSLFRPPRT